MSESTKTNNFKLANFRPVISSKKKPRHQIQFGVFFQGVNFSTIWHWPNSGSQIDFESFRRVIKTAERGKFAAFFVGEGLRLREHLGKIHELDVAGRPDAQTLEAALAGVTSHIGLVATQSTTYNDPADLAYRLASLNLLSGGRNAWNVVTTHNAWTGENFRRGGYVSGEDRYLHAGAFVEAVDSIWNAWSQSLVAKSSAAASFVQGVASPLRIQNDFYELEVRRSLPLVNRPVLFQAGDSNQGRDFAARYADVIFSAHPQFDDGTRFAIDIAKRAAKFGRKPGSISAFPGTSFFIGDTDEEAWEKYREIKQAQVTPQTAIAYLEQFWGRDLSEYDPDGPLPEVDPVVKVSNETRGSGFQNAKAKELTDRWRSLAKDNGWSIRDFVIYNSALGHDSDPTGFVGSVKTIADHLEKYAYTGIVSGFNITPYLVPSGLDEIVNQLVPELQDRGIYPSEYRGTTLRENLGLD